MKLHDILAKVFKHRDIVKPIAGRPTLYLRRFYLARTRWGSVFLHYIAMSDDDRYCHDHPWDFWTFILKGGYNEEIESEHIEPLTKKPKVYIEREHAPGLPRVVRYERQRAPKILFRKAEHTHRVHIPPSIPAAWTIVVAKPAKRVWGFHTNRGWVDWRTYLGLPDAIDHAEDVIRERQR